MMVELLGYDGGAIRLWTRLSDVCCLFQYRASKLAGSNELTKEHPMVDYTPPAYITLLFTDLGVLTPSAVSDELIKLYL